MKTDQVLDYEEQKTVLVKWVDRDEMARNQTWSFYHNSKYSDVTLGAEGKFIAAHKLILASCSQYFNVSNTNLCMNQSPEMFLFHIFLANRDFLS